MEPIPETVQAVNELDSFDEGSEVLEFLQWTGARVLDIVPDCVGFSLASQRHGVTFTLVATTPQIAALDALQYVGRGPCVEAVEAERVLGYDTDSLADEDGWQLFARGAARNEVASTLTLPILGRGNVVGSVNLYAGSMDSFVGHHEAMARIFDAWAPGAVTNADMDFTTRLEAEKAPGVLRTDMRIQVAVGILASIEDVAVEKARHRLADAARRTGLREAEVAEAVIAASTQPPGGAAESDNPGWGAW